MPDRIDLVRGLTVFRIAATGETLVIDVSLCPGARVYSFTLDASINDPSPDVAARLHLQDSVFEVLQGGILRADLPGLKWPASAKLDIIGAAAAATGALLHVTYGNCA